MQIHSGHMISDWNFRIKPRNVLTGARIRGWHVRVVPGALNLSRIQVRVMIDPRLLFAHTLAQCTLPSRGRVVKALKAASVGG